MPLTGAERQRRYLQKLKDTNPEKLKEIKRKNLEQTKSKYKKANELTKNERDLQRRKWREQKRDKNTKKNSEESQDNTEEKVKRKVRYQLRKENLNLKSTINLLLKKVQSLKKQIYRYKKQIRHLKEIVEISKKQSPEKETLNVTIKNNNETPYSKTENFIQQNLPQILTPEKNIVKKVLFENILIKDSLTKQYSKSTSNYERNTLKNVLTNDFITQYKMKTKMSTAIGLKGRIRSRNLLKDRKIRRLKELSDFLNRDDNTRASAGKKEYRTLNKRREQVRYLLDTMKNLHAKYKNEGAKLSYAMFTRYKPFYIVAPKISDRNTCACVKHANLNFMATKLKKLNVIKSDNLSQLVSTISCNIDDPKCMYNECKKCCNKILSYDVSQRNLNEVVTCNRWVTKKHEYNDKITKRTVKEEVTHSLETLLQTFCDEMLLFKKHYFNISHQYRMYKTCKDNLTEQEVLLHCDFSENYACKLAEEVQALHFGASKRQISLHTGVFYAKSEDELQTTSFCTISPNINHGPGAIWAHLTPVLKLIKEQYPHVTTLHFYSDGPTTQYRQKKNFYMINKMTSLYGFEKATWSFFEACHGKGAADGIGGATKRNLDRYVTHGQDIPDAEAAYKALINSESSKIKYFYVSDENVNAFVKDLDSSAKDLIPVPNTHTIHQVISMPNTDSIKYRKLSCFCGTISGFCACFDAKEHNLKQKMRNKKTKVEMKGKTLKAKRRRIEPNDSTSDEDEISYAESGDSSWEGDHLQSDNYDEDKTMEEEGGKQTEKAITNVNKKVTILSDIRFKPENKRYFNLNDYGPFTFKKVDMNIQINKNIYDNPIPSTSNFDKKNSIKKEMRKNTRLHQTLGECDLREVDTVDEMMEEKENDRNYFEQNITAETENNDKTQNEAKKQGELETEWREGIYSINDSVLVRYYEKRKWIYYVGFIESIDIQENEIKYKVRFLKTLQKPQLKFIVPKKIDEDIVPAINVVKIIDLKSISNEFMLTNNSDQIYF